MERIKQLDPLVAQRIAAGEVIERPASVVRELLDNAIDAQAKTITVQVVSGGIERITVIDDGIGIQSEDLPLCCRSHATSKIATLEDLFNLSTMGFRGEALYSIAASAKITIASTHAESKPTTLIIDNGQDAEIIPGGPDRGTRIDVEHLFAAIPARRLFLKRPATESTMCRNTMVEKARAFPEISFRFYDGETLRMDLPATTPKQRILDTLAHDGRVIPTETTELRDQASRFSLYAVASTPAYYRTDRSHIAIYVNQRLIDEFALVQAVTYGYREMLPGGAFPYCYLFVTVDPELVDFNIHPAKREAKLRNKAEIHHQIVVMVRQQISKSLPRLSLETQPTAQPELHNLATSESPKGYQGKKNSSSQSFFNQNQAKPHDNDWFQRAKEILEKQPTPVSVSTPKTEDFAYLGQVFNLFLVVQRGDALYLIDQHAAHERILFDQIRQDKGIQRLIIPLQFEVERSVDEFLTNHAPWYADYGLELKRIDDLEWELSSIPALWKPIEQAVVKFISSHSSGDLGELEKELYANIACHGAIKDGDNIDRITAETLIKQVFQLEHPVCPHGRTFVVEITKEHLWRAVGRTM